ncbi:MAG: hypothetical protein HOV92_00570 [Streptomyces sp.]|nr:hypothetical protein [Streptomyces sp.]
MIAEAVDVVLTLGWALLAWIVLMAVVAGVVLHAVVVTVAVVCRTAWRGVTAARRALYAPVSHELPPSDSRPATVPERPTAAHVPSWARTDEEAA